MGDRTWAANGSVAEWGVQQALVPVLDALIMATGVTGHSLVILALAGRKRRRRRPPRGTDALLLTLSAADLLLLACLPFHTAAIALGAWPFGDFLCKAVSFLGVACSSASVFTLAALAVSRHTTVVHPAWAFARRGTGRRLKAAVVLLWGPACSLAAPQFAFRAVDAAGATQCFAFLSDLSQLVYSTSLFIFAFALPLLVIVLMYGKIYLFLRRTRLQGHAPQLERYQSQVTLTCALLVLVFTTCWLPSYTFMLLLAGGHGSARYRSYAIVVRQLASLSVVANPVLYVFMSHKFRRQLREVGRRCCLAPGRDAVRPPNPVELETPPPQRCGDGK